jgi:ATP:cob(I)alamin adenosyltransferase
MMAYQGIGDSGCTMIHRCKIEKDSPLIVVIGSIDDLQSALDMARLYTLKKRLHLIEKIQDRLRFLAGEIAGYVDDVDKLISEKDIEEIEKIIQDLGGFVPNEFIRFNYPESVYLNEARVRTRTLERNMVDLFKQDKIRNLVYSYVNRLSDLFFVMSYEREMSLKKD